MLLLAAYPSETWLLGRLLDMAVTTARARAGRDDRLRRVVIRGPGGEELGSLEFEYGDDRLSGSE